MTEENFQATSQPETELGYDILTAGEFPLDEIQTYRSQVHNNATERERLSRLLDEIPEAEATQNQEKILRKGIGLWVLGRYREACDTLQHAKGHAVGSLLLGRSLLSSGRVEEAAQTFETLAKSEGGNGQALTGILGCLADQGRWEELGKRLEASPAPYQETADHLYFKGRLAEADGDAENAVQSYEKALDRDEDHRNSMFRLAYLLDLYGMDDEAIEVYERLSHTPPVDASAVINLGILYEDRGQYRKAAACFESVVRTNPTHSRARAFLKDAQASLNMYYDEDLEKKEDKLQQILRIPITDFELSVRARNCLAKMEIDTLGDLVKKTEPELLSFKNFGETSLNEIKEILTSKGLRLGLTRTDDALTEAPAGPPPALEEGASPDLLDRPVSELELSVRSRRTVENLGIRSLGELVALSEKELLTKPNFGQTSMNEIKEKLRAIGLKLAD